MNKYSKFLSLFFIGLTCAATAIAQPNKQVRYAENFLASGDEESLLEAKTEIDKASTIEGAAAMPKYWMIRAMVYSRLVERQGNELIAPLSKGAGYISGYSMARFWKAPSTDKDEIENARLETRNSLAVCYSESNEFVTARNYDSAIQYYRVLMYLFDKMDTANQADLKNHGLSKKFIIDNLAIIASQATNPELKLYVLSEIVDAGSTSPVVFEALSKAYLAKGDTANAEAIVRKGLSRDPNNNNMFQILINFYVSVHNEAALFTDLNQQIQRSPSSRLHYSRGYLYETRGEFDNAMADYREAIKLDDFNSDAHYNYGAGLINYETRKLYDELAKAKGDQVKVVNEKLKALFREAKVHLEMASENKDYSVKEQINIFKALKTVALELDDKEGVEKYTAIIKTLEESK